MNTPAILAHALSKRYRIGARHVRHDTLASAIAGWVRSPLENFRRARQLSHFAEGDEQHVLWALREVSFEITRGEVVGIIGRNGAGKSTLLKILSRIAEPTSGHADVYGRVSSLLEVGTGFHPDLTGRENVYLNGTILGMTKVEVDRKFDAIVDFAEVSTFIDTPVKRYSSGMKVRLAFAVAAFMEPEILLVDEVLSVGDVAFQKKCLGKMHDVTAEGRTVVFVSHAMSAVKSLCDRVLLLQAGRVAMDGEVDCVVNTYLREGIDTAQDGHVPDSAARVGTGEARIRAVEVMDDAGQKTLQVFFGERFRVQLQIEVFKPLAGILFEVSVKTRDGFHVVQTMSTDGEGALFHLARGVHFIRADLQSALLPGEFSLTVGLHYSGGTTVDFIEDVRGFEVLHVARNGRDHYRWAKVRGCVRLGARWTIAPREADAPGASPALTGPREGAT